MDALADEIVGQLVHLVFEFLICNSFPFKFDRYPIGGLFDLQENLFTTKREREREREREVTYLFFEELFYPHSLWVRSIVIVYFHYELLLFLIGQHGQLMGILFFPCGGDSLNERSEIIG